MPSNLVGATGRGKRPAPIAEWVALRDGAGRRCGGQPCRYAGIQ